MLNGKDSEKIALWMARHSMHHHRKYLLLTVYEYNDTKFMSIHIFCGIFDLVIGTTKYIMYENWESKKACECNVFAVYFREDWFNKCSSIFNHISFAISIPIPNPSNFREMCMGPMDWVRSTLKMKWNSWIWNRFSPKYYLEYFLLM